jgi:hypothetical protein
MDFPESSFPSHFGGQFASTQQAVKCQWTIHLLARLTHSLTTYVPIATLFANGGFWISFYVDITPSPPSGHLAGQTPTRHSR